MLPLSIQMFGQPGGQNRWSELDAATFAGPEVNSHEISSTSSLMAKDESSIIRSIDKQIRSRLAVNDSLQECIAYFLLKEEGFIFLGGVPRGVTPGVPPENRTPKIDPI